jgi:cytidylate kinase
MHPTESSINSLIGRLQSSRLRIAIDGPAGAGKSTLARKVAESLGYLYIDTGAMYRAATLIVLRAGIALDDDQKIGAELGLHNIELLASSNSEFGQRVLVDGVDESDSIRSREIANQVSAISALPSVRTQLVAHQRSLAAAGAVVLDGRDIGTVVLPDAEVKIFLVASPNVRAHRRYLELRACGQKIDLETVLQEIIERDRKDSSRTLAPLKPATDAIVIESDNRTVEQLVAEIIELCGRVEVA